MICREFMTSNPATCSPEDNLQDCARLMLERNCGEIPVVDREQGNKLLGVITDRDIVLRSVAQGRNPLELKVRDCMTSPCISVTPETSLENCIRILEENQIRRVPVVDENGACIGIVAQADVARLGPQDKAGELLREVSKH